MDLALFELLTFYFHVLLHRMTALTYTYQPSTKFATCDVLIVEFLLFTKSFFKAYCLFFSLFVLRSLI